MEDESNIKTSGLSNDSPQEATTRLMDRGVRGPDWTVLCSVVIVCAAVALVNFTARKETMVCCNTAEELNIAKKLTELETRLKHIETTSDKSARKQDHVAFYAQLTTDKSGIPNHQTLAFDNVMINLGNGYNGMSGVFTAPSTGLYAFHWTNTNADRSYMNTELIVKNQVYGKAMSDAMDHDDYAVASNLAIAQLEKGDQVWVRSGTWHSGKLRGDLYSTFSGYRMQ